ncbi:PTS sugar transporter subunit IIB [Alkalibaculum bacchi]|jgi:PTS system galactitol-specific IIB component|uniref:PTS sugar transporter subunit IIB n=1 Tax=Alkalibaculum bacchi TaxID=645887 RepID=UPI0026ED6F72|nr:PTS sugar transporter subunit IIB [Alkalibaculum bacchi]MCI1934023.1 PTS sugar transporter subunit IIB [Atopobiaceae bacterium]
MGLFNKKNKKVEVKTNSVVANNPKLSSQKTNKKQKKILLSCGSGIVTSTIARKKVEELLDTHGYKGQYLITQIPLASAPEKSRDYDFIVATSIAPKELHCAYVNGTPYLSGIGVEKPNEEILKLMDE